VRKKKATVGRTKKTAPQIVNAPMPVMPLQRVAQVPYLFSDNQEGQLQKLGEVSKVPVKPVLLPITKPLVKPAKYQRVATTIPAPKVEKAIEEPKSRVNLESIKQKMKTEKEPYNPVLGVNIPVKREGQFVQKETGLLVPETRGAPSKDERMMKEMIGQTRLDKFFK
jgi:hypothetical protein